VDLGVYAFASDTCVVSPFGSPFAERGPYVAGLRQLGSITGLGGATCMGWALTRMAGDMLERFDDDWRKLLVVVTDGYPNSCGNRKCDQTQDVGEVVRKLRRDHEFEAVGIGIKVAGMLPGIFNSWATIDTAQELPKELTRSLRRSIRKG
jgi:nitric oxide reductase activation protein